MVETQMIDLQTERELKHWENSGIEDTMRLLIKIRRNLLAEMFVMDEHYKKLLAEFNEAMKQQLIQMRLETIKTAQCIVAGTKRDVQTIGKCFLGFSYSKIHPIQTMRAKKVWAILNGTFDCHVRFYDVGVMGCRYFYDSRMETRSENQMLYLSEEPDNWNEGLDKEMTKDMHLIYPFHDLTNRMNLSIFDLLWVRDFDIEIEASIEYDSYADNEKGE